MYNDVQSILIGRIIVWKPMRLLRRVHGFLIVIFDEIDLKNENLFGDVLR